MGQSCWQCHTIAGEIDWVFTPSDGWVTGGGRVFARAAARHSVDRIAEA